MRELAQSKTKNNPTGFEKQRLTKEIARTFTLSENICLTCTKISFLVKENPKKNPRG